MERWIFFLQLGSCWFMTGLIWFVQVVHYPLFAQVGEQGYQAFQQQHMRLTTYVVMPAMLLELATALALLAYPLDKSLWWIAAANASALILIWASTFFLQVPLHNQLMSGHNPEVIGKLVGTNWVRTILWSGRAIALLVMLSLYLKKTNGT